METLFLSAHIFICVVLVVLVLLQSGKEGMGVIFGGGSSSLFGASGAGGILVKLTAFAAIAFAFTSLGYNVVSTERKPTKSVIMDVQIEDLAPKAPAAVQNSTVPGKE